MTTTDQPTRRETLSSVREKGKLRPIMITMQSTFVTVRLKGCRHSSSVTYQQIFNIGARNAAEAARKERVEARAAKRKERSQ